MYSIEPIGEPTLPLFERVENRNPNFDLEIYGCHTLDLLATSTQGLARSITAYREATGSNPAKCQATQVTRALNRVAGGLTVAHTLEGKVKTPGGFQSATLITPAGIAAVLRKLEPELAFAMMDEGVAGVLRKASGWDKQLPSSPSNAQSLQQKALEVIQGWTEVGELYPNLAEVANNLGEARTLGGWQTLREILEARYTHIHRGDAGALSELVRGLAKSSTVPPRRRLIELDGKKVYGSYEYHSSHMPYIESQLPQLEFRRPWLADSKK